MTIEDSAADRDLWQRAATGDGDAFAEIYRRYPDRIYGYCFRRTASWSTAQDLTSVVFLEAWRKRGDVAFDDDGSVIAWLFGVANNMVRNSHRSMRRHQLALQRLPDRWSSLTLLMTPLPDQTMRTGCPGFWLPWLASATVIENCWRSRLGPALTSVRSSFPLARTVRSPAIARKPVDTGRRVWHWVNLASPDDLTDEVREFLAETYALDP